MRNHLENSAPTIRLQALVRAGDFKGRRPMRNPLANSASMRRLQALLPAMISKEDRRCGAR